MNLAHAFATSSERGLTINMKSQSCVSGLRPDIPGIKLSTCVGRPLCFCKSVLPHFEACIVYSAHTYCDIHGIGVLPEKRTFASIWQCSLAFYKIAQSP